VLKDVADVVFADVVFQGGSYVDGMRGGPAGMQWRAK
jgi:hypothetical protein